MFINNMFYHVLLLSCVLFVLCIIIIYGSSSSSSSSRSSSTYVITSRRADRHRAGDAYRSTLFQEGTASLRFRTFRKINMFGSVRKIGLLGSTRFGLRFSDASWLVPVRFGSLRLAITNRPKVAGLAWRLSQQQAELARGAAAQVGGPGALVYTRLFSNSAPP